MPIDKGSDRGEQHRPDDWERINTEWDARDKAQREYDAKHDPGEQWERSARPLPEDYRKDRPASRTVTREEIDEMVGLWGQRAVDRRIASGKLVVAGDDGTGEFGVREQTGARVDASGGDGGDGNDRGAPLEQADGDDPDPGLRRRERADHIRDEVDLGDKARELPNAGDVLPNVDRAEIPLPKFADYSMSPAHPANRGKAEGWRTLGYDVDDPDARRDAAEDVTDLLSHELLRDGKVARTDTLPDGAKHQVWNGFIGPNGRHATLVTGWLVADEGEHSHPKLTTTWVQPHKETER